VRRRTVITGLAVAATIPRSWAQQPLVPVVGYLSGRSRDTDEALVAAFREGLADGGYLEGRNVAIEYVSADGHADRLGGPADELVRRHVGALYVVDDPLFTGRRKQIAALAKRHSVATISTLREFAETGALASYGTSFAAVHRECGVYVARILKGENPGDLPIMLPTRFTLVVNLKTAQALGSTVPASLLALADEVIE
jgi:putative tryptophan/tyrosine transport system substrate-binding protein